MPDASKKPQPRRVILWRGGTNYEIKMSRDGGSLASFCEEWLKVTRYDIPPGHYQQIKIVVEALGKVRPLEQPTPAPDVFDAPERPADELRVADRGPERADHIAERVLEDQGRAREERIQAERRELYRLERQQRERDDRGILRVDHASGVRMGERDPHMAWANEEIVRFDQRQARERRDFLLHIERELQRRRQPQEARFDPDNWRR